MNETAPAPENPQSPPENVQPDTELASRDDRAFNQDMDALLDSAETMRLNAMKVQRNRGFIAMSVGLATICVGAAGFGWFLLVEAQLVRGLGAIVLGVVIAAALHIWSGQALKQYERDYKHKFLPRMAHILGGLKYYPSRGISEKLLKRTGVIPSHEVYDAEDCFMGQYKGVKVLFSEARLRFKKAYEEPAFNGIFVLLEASKANIEGHTIVTANKEMVQKWGATRWKKLQALDHKPENPTWDRFSIYSDTPDAAEGLVDEKMFKELAEASDIFDKSPITAVFFAKKFIFMMIPYEGDMFEPSNIHVPVTTKRTAIQCKKELEKILEIIDIFELYQ